MMLHANNFSLKYEYENLVVVVAAVVVAVVICSLFLSDIIPQTTDCPTSRQTDRKRNISQNILHKMQFYEDYLSHVLDFYMRF